MALIDDIYQHITPTHLLYIRLKKNHLEIKHIKSGKTIKGSSEKPFSNERLLIADYLIAEAYAKELIAELLNSKRKLLDRALTIVFQPADESIPDITPSEKRIYVDFASFIGAKYYYLVEHKRRLLDEEVREVVKGKQTT